MGDRALAAGLLHVSEQAIERLAASVYTRALLEGCLKEKLGGELPPDLTPPQKYLLTLEAGQLAVLALRLGCACYARAIMAVINGEALRKLADQTTLHLMQDAAWGMTYLAGHGSSQNTDPLAQTIRASGLACLRVWCVAQPRPIAVRVHLLLPARSEDEEAPLQHPEHLVEAFVMERFHDNA